MHLILLLLFSCSPATKINSLPDQEIRWKSDKKLTYADFKGRVPSATTWAATTNSMIYFAYQTLNGSVSEINVYSSFIPSKSWIKRKLPEVLAHEQLHFDITEAFARKFYAEAIKKSYGPGDGLNKLFREVNDECDQLQQLYDDETNHGIVAEEQEKWSLKVRKLLELYEPYPQNQHF
ncbi:MAG: hypothetical protein ABIQ74_13435 [Chitinophagales bacterium]